jgi:2-haloacid dehalogenase
MGRASGAFAPRPFIERQRCVAEGGVIVKYRWLLFDADGTLFDYDTAEAEALAATYDQAGVEYHPDALDIYRTVNGELWLDFERGTVTQDRLKVERFEALLEATGISADPQFFSRRYLENLGTRTDLIDGADEIVSTLAGKSRILIITNGIASVQRPRFSSSAIRNHLSGFVISEEVGSAKPAPEIFEAAFSQMDNPSRDDVLMIGDSLTSDIKGGNDFGIHTCWYNPDGEPGNEEILPTYEIRSLDDLLAVVGFDRDGQ